MDTNIGTTEPDSSTTGAGAARSRRRGHAALAGVAFAGVLAIGAGTALAASTEPPPANPTQAPSTATMDQMHDSEPCRSMRQQLPPELRAQMDQMHARMRELVPAMGDAMVGSNMGSMTGRTAPGR